MDNIKLSGILYIAAGALFVFSGFVGGNLLTLPLGAVFVLLGLRKLKSNDNQEQY